MIEIIDVVVFGFHFDNYLLSHYCKQTAQSDRSDTKYRKCKLKQELVSLTYLCRLLYSNISYESFEPNVFCMKNKVIFIHHKLALDRSSPEVELRSGPR